MNYATRGNVMGAAQKIEIQDFDEVFTNIAKLYDHAEDILKVAYHESVEDKEKFALQIEAIVSQIEESANTIAEDFSNLIESGKEPSNRIKQRVALSMKKILTTLDQYQEYVK